MKTFTYIYSYSSYLLDGPRQQIQYEQDYVEKGLLGPNFPRSVCIPNACMCGWDCEHAPHHLNGSSTIHHKPKFVGFFAQAQREFCALCRKVSSCLRTVSLLPAFFAFFSILTDQCLLRAHWNYSSPHIQGKLIYCAPSAHCMQTTQCDQDVQCVPSFILCPHTCFFTFVKGMCHSTSSNTQRCH